jgi:NlpC/P60 family putative phage cell wall peptidase
MATTVLTRAAIVAEARTWIGTPYRHQASLRGVGCDCLGLVRGIWRNLIGPEPESVPVYAADWAEAGGVESFADAAGRHLRPMGVRDFRPGDVLLFRWRERTIAKHAAIAATPEAMIHAHDGIAVCEVPLSPWWCRRLAYVFRFPGVED